MIERLLRLTARNGASPIEWRVWSPVSGGSTLITSAPMSPSIWPQNGPAITWQSSTTRRPSSALTARDAPAPRPRRPRRRGPRSAAPSATPHSVPASIRSLKSPRWPIRNTLSWSLPSPAPSDMSKRSRITRRTSSEPSSITAVSAPENSRSSSASTSRPQPCTAARVAAAWRAWRAKTLSRPSSRSSIEQRLAQPVEQVRGARVGPVAGLVGGHDRRPVPVRARQLRILGRGQRLLGDRVEGQARGQHQALLRAADGDVDAPLVVAVVDRRQRRDRVHEQQRVVVAHRGAHVGHAARDAGRGLVVHDAHGAHVVVERSRRSAPGRRRGASRPRATRRRARAARPSRATASRSGRSPTRSPCRRARAC